MNNESITLEQVISFIDGIKDIFVDERTGIINDIRKALHSVSPFADEPVDCVLWVNADKVKANDYNPNKVAPPEMELLYRSIAEDGFTQPIVSWCVDGVYEVVDGFHRNRVGREYLDIKKRTYGYLPLTVINVDRQSRGDRIASTIRHNRARGKHQVESMSDIVIELKHRNWSDEKICKELGMEPDEVLRLCQITGLANLFSDKDFSKAWEVEGDITESDFKDISDDVAEYSDSDIHVRTVNTNDPDRIFHTYEKWECYKSGFYATAKEGMSKAECEIEFFNFLANDNQFTEALEHVVTEWKHSCEQYLTNTAMNRIAWLGQAAACYALGIPAVFRSGFWLLSVEQQERANNIALKYLNEWLARNGRKEISLDDAIGGRQSDIY